ncbi:alpha/beta hydrolase [Devosia rhizoryzae]|uniref:Alpha/beta hydrolase n=1 Tax=Devosia rhizoryzae TaxID=2774137 RepID=A0ABX7C432_9HYPH|nr:alpha/beta hydrolase [Devosia rhizoryzae]QQR38971.1 alpha/beta hydrolase [Devosia rhizoryzae]
MSWRNKEMVMATILFIHSAGAQGLGEGSSRFLANLRATMPAGWTLLAPPMPEPDAPSAAPWIAATAEALASVEGEFVTLGHSLGGSTLLQALARHGNPPGLLGVVLLAVPFWSAADWNVAEFALDRGDIQNLANVGRVILLQGSADEVVPADHAQHHADILPRVEIQSLQGADHEAADAAAAVLQAVHDLVSAKL